MIFPPKPCPLDTGSTTEQKPKERRLVSRKQWSAETDQLTHLFLGDVCSDHHMQDLKKLVA